jgi:cyclopropane fatty-acyl-phospholipid synthase-like methyltransferase
MAKTTQGGAPRRGGARDEGAKEEAFDRRYFDRFYEDTTRVHGREEIARLASGVAGLVEWFRGEPIETVLDVGAGAGLWRDWFKTHRPDVRYRSTDVSAYACKRYGHEQRDVSKWRAKERFDLVVCQGVLPYLPDDDAARAIENLAAMCGGFLYLEAITDRDLREACDLGATDVAVYRRKGSWYKAELRRHFKKIGAGLYAIRGGDAVFYELEACEP